MQSYLYRPQGNNKRHVSARIPADEEVRKTDQPMHSNELNPKAMQDQSFPGTNTRSPSDRKSKPLKTECRIVPDKKED